MAEQSQSDFDGIYVAYFTGSAGSSIGMFVFKDGVIAGADAGGGRYDGDYELTEDRFGGVVRFTLPIGNQSITGTLAEAEPIAIEVPLNLPIQLHPEDVHRIETPLGPINAKFQKIRGL